MQIFNLLKAINQRDVVTIEPSVRLLDAAELMKEYNIGALPVVDEADHIIGILSERDIVRLFANKQVDVSQCLISDAMTVNVFTCKEDDNVDAVFDTMCAKNIRHMPVAADQILVSILSLRDFAALYRSFSPGPG